MDTCSERSFRSYSGSTVNSRRPLIDSPRRNHQLTCNSDDEPRLRRTKHRPPPPSQPGPVPDHVPSRVMPPPGKNHPPYMEMGVRQFRNPHHDPRFDKRNLYKMSSSPIGGSRLSNQAAAARSDSELTDQSDAIPLSASRHRYFNQPPPPPHSYYQPQRGRRAVQGGAVSDPGEAWEKDTVLTGSSVENLCSDLANQETAQPPELHGDPYEGPGLCERFYTPSVTLLVLTFLVLTPSAFFALPKLVSADSSCSPQCGAGLVALVVKSLILLIGCWELFARTPRWTLPAVDPLRAFLLLFTSLFLLSFWAFYLLRVLTREALLDPAAGEQLTLAFAHHTADCALFLLLLAALLLEAAHFRQRVKHVIKVVRSVDGESRVYTVGGRMSVQDCAAFVLDRYYTDFSSYNPHKSPSRLSKPAKTTANSTVCNGGVMSNESVQQYKFYDIDGCFPPPGGAMSGHVTGVNNNSVIDKSRAIIAASARKRDAGHNERFYEEQELERRVKKRRARLSVAAEEAFAHIRRAADEGEGCDKQGVHAQPMTAEESARAIFPSMARALQKYLKITNQQHHYTQESIYEHLSRCLTLGFTARAFVAEYVSPAGPVIASQPAQVRRVQSWELASELTPPNRHIARDTVFQLKQDQISLVVFVMGMPHFHIRHAAPASSDATRAPAFVLRLDSETSV